MRKSRGKSINSKEWVYGWYVNKGGKKHQIVTDESTFPIDVIPESAGRPTYQKDINGKDVYEGDIFREETETDDGDIRSYKVVMWIEQRSAFYLVDVSHFHVLQDNDCSKETEFSWLFDDAALYDFSIDVKIKSGVIGNMIDKPELLS